MPLHLNRRRLVAGLSLAGIASAARSQGGPVEGRDYTRLSSPLPVAAAPGKVEVVEFFGYWCPHCNAFEPALDAWARRLPPDVAFRRVPVAFTASHEPYQRLYYALEAMGLVDTMHRKVFEAVHVQKMRLERDNEVAALMSANGVDAAKVAETMKSFAVGSKLPQARKLVETYHIDGVPTLGIHGRYMTSPGTAGTGERALQVTNQLIQMARKT